VVPGPGGAEVVVERAGGAQVVNSAAGETDIIYIVNVRDRAARSSRYQVTPHRKWRDKNRPHNGNQPRNAVIPVILKVSFNSLSAGPYRAEVTAMNSAGQTSTVRAAEFELQ
jgi:hypothetical protein